MLLLELVTIGAPNVMIGACETYAPINWSLLLLEHFPIVTISNSNIFTLYTGAKFVLQ